MKCSVVNRVHQYSRLLSIILDIALLVFLASSLLYSASADNNNYTTIQPQTQKTRITVKPLSSLILRTTHSAPAQIISLNQSQLSAQLSAEVKKIKVDIGDNVKKGSALVELDCRDYRYVVQQTQAAYLARKAQARFAKQTFLRNQQLIQQSTIPQVALEQAESDYLSIQEDLKALKAQLKIAKLNTERCIITAPFAGQITQRYIQQGQLVIPNTPVFELLQTDQLFVDAELSRQKVTSIQQAKQIAFNLNAQDTPVQLEKIVSLVKKNTQTQAVRFSLTNVAEFPIHNR